MNPTGEGMVNMRPDCCKAPVGRACFELVIPSEAGGGGWVLVNGSLIRRFGDYDARLYYDLGDGYSEDQSFDVPATSKGIINELICLPAGIKRLSFSPMGVAGEFQLGSLAVRRIGPFARTLRMAHRVLSMIFLHSSQKRKLVKLTCFEALVNLHGAYKIAGKLLPHAGAPRYQDWIRQFDELAAEDRLQIGQHISSFANPPHFHVLIVLEGMASSVVQKTLDSMKEQIYAGFTCTVIDVAGVSGWLEQFNVALAGRHAGDWVMLLRAGDVLAPHALYQFAYEVQAHPEVVAVYSDHDELDVNAQRCKPRFKPDWSLTHLRSTNFVGNAVALRGKEVAAAGGVNLDCCRHGIYDLLLRVMDVVGHARATHVAHISSVLLHRTRTPLSGGVRWDWDAPHWNMEALRAHLARNGVMSEVSETLPGCWRVRYQLPEVPPLVSIIVPTRDEPALIRQCVESLLAKTTYPRLEILVVDNQSADVDALAYLEQITCHERVRVLKYDQPFNYSAMNNMAAREAGGEVLCLLNNDTEVISPDWLDEMVGHLLQPGVGVVGAKLYFQNGQVQHGGDLVGVGNVASHAHIFLSHGDPGYCNRAAVAQEYSAVTGACMIVRKPLYDELLGLDEQHLPVAFNDVDFCLRVRESGYRVVWTPHAELYHYEKVSRGKDRSPETARRARREVAYMRKRWKCTLSRDPFYNPNLSYERPDFSLSNAPVIERPWQS